MAWNGKIAGFIGLLISVNLTVAGTQQPEKLAYETRLLLQKSITDRAIPSNFFEQDPKKQAWLHRMSLRLAQYVPSSPWRSDLLRTVYYEATRTGLDPQLVLAIIEVESHFDKYAISTAGARGLMQVMPFWVKTIGVQNQNLFDLRINLRYGCTIMRHYLDLEKGNLYRALGRYNGSLGQPEYPNLVLKAWRKNWVDQEKPVSTAQ